MGTKEVCTVLGGDFIMTKNGNFSYLRGSIYSVQPLSNGQCRVELTGLKQAGGWSGSDLSKVEALVEAADKLIASGLIKDRSALRLTRKNATGQFVPWPHIFVEAQAEPKVDLTTAINQAVSAALAAAGVKPVVTETPAPAPEAPSAPAVDANGDEVPF